MAVVGSIVRPAEQWTRESPVRDLEDPVAIIKTARRLACKGGDATLAALAANLLIDSRGDNP